MRGLRERLEFLEREKKDSVEGTLSKIFFMLRTKDAPFSKDMALDLVLNLKMVAQESNHPKAGYYRAVLQALREKMSSPDELFRHYINGLLGDKDQEEVLKKIAQVDKAEKARPTRQPRVGARASPYNVRCYACNAIGHLQRNCYLRHNRQGRGRRRFREPAAPQQYCTLQDNSK